MRRFPSVRRFGAVPMALVCLDLLSVALAQDPAITSQPQSITNRAGLYPTFSVVATGTAPLEYQWYKDSQPLGPYAGWSGQRTSALMIHYARKTNEGTYFVVVSNGIGQVTSSTATLTVQDPALSSQTYSLNLPVRTMGMVSATAAGTPPFGYQWRFNGSPIATATNSTLSLYGSPTNAGPYDVTVSNSYGSVTSATCVVTVNTSFADDWIADANALVHATAVQSDGRVVVGGSFTALGSYARNRIGRVYADGTVDAQFNPNASGDVYCLLQQPDGKLVVGGAFTSLGGRTCRYLGRLNVDGSLDTNFTAIASGTIYCLAWQSDGQILAGGVNELLRFDQTGAMDATFNPSVVGTIYSIVVQPETPTAVTGIVVGGSFFSIAGGGRQNLARLGWDGSLDNLFNTPVTGTIYAMALQAGGGLVLGGQFTKFGQTTRVNLARVNLTGGLDQNFDPGASNVVYSLATQVDGKILVGGGFTTLAGVQRAFLGRLLPNGTIDPLFNPGANQTVYSLAQQADGRIVAGGLFTSFGNGSRRYVGRLEATNDVAQSIVAAGGKVTWMRGGALPDIDSASFDVYVPGTGWAPLGAGERVAGGWQVSATVDPNATLRGWGKAVGGRGGGSGSLIQFAAGPVVILTQPLGRNVTSPTTTVLSVEATGTGPFTYQWFRNGALLTGATDAVYPNGSLGSYQVVVCNPFGCVQSEIATIWRLNGVESAARPNTDYGVYALALQADGKVLLGGSFSTAWSTPRRGLARLNTDGSLDPAFDPDVGGTVFCLATQPDGRILLGGSFTNVGGTARSCLARIHADGTLDTSFTANAGGGALGTGVYCLSPQSDGRTLVGGSFSIISGQNRQCLARLESDGNADLSFVPGANLHPDRMVNSILQTADGLIMVGGRFATAPNSYHTYQWLQSDGSYAGSGYPGPLQPSSAVYALLEQPDGGVWLGGYDVRIDTTPGRMLARLHASHSPDTAFTASADGPVFCLVAQADGKVLVGGAFTSLNGVSRSGLGRLNRDGSLDTAFNPVVTGTGTCVYAAAPQTDGKVCLGGTFTNVAGSTRYNFARLPATGFVSENWTHENSMLNWTRVGPQPELDSTWLESSPDGLNWQLLTQGTRVGDSWQFRDFSLPPRNPFRVRAEVRASGINSWQTFTLLQAPEITTQPLSRTNGFGSIAGFHVAVQGQGPFKYQWFHNGIPLQDEGPISGARTALLAFTVSALSVGDYMVTVSNLFGSVTSSPARLTVFDPLAPPIILTQEEEFGFGTNGFSFRIQGVPGQACVIERSTTLQFWVAVKTNVLNSFDPVAYSDASTPGTTRFYRVRLQP